MSQTKSFNISGIPTIPAILLVHGVRDETLTLQDVETLYAALVSI